LIIFMSDNGSLWGEHRLRGKYMPYDGATRIPLILRWDRRVGAGSRNPRLALNVDIAATIADAARVSRPPIEGRSLLGRGSRGGFVLEAAKTSRNDGNGQKVARPAYCGFRTMRFLYVRYTGGVEELYDYTKDRWELTNLARRPASSDILGQLRRKTRRACRPMPPSFSW
jgi:arylsulfatase A-like enzyme